jgi:hypothetical protein
MPTREHPDYRAGHDTLAAALPSSSDIAHAPSDAPSAQLTPWPSDEADDLAQDLDHLIVEIDEVFGFTEGGCSPQRRRC